MSSERKDNPSYLSGLPPGDRKAIAETLRAVAIGDNCTQAQIKEQRAAGTNPLLASEKQGPRKAGSLKPEAKIAGGNRQPTTIRDGTEQIIWESK